MARVWREAGHEVTFLFGTKRYVPADLALLHVNLSVVPQRYIQLARRYPIVLNGEVTDIRKSTFSRNILQRNDEWDGRVMIKSDLNYGGYPELTLKRSWLTRKFRTVRRARRLIDRLTGRAPRIAESTDYKIYDRLTDVPPEFFDEDGIVVEKFLPEKQDEFYHVRVYEFLGDRGQCVRLAGKNPVVKGATCESFEEIEVPGEILGLCNELRLHFGKLDYVVNDGKIVLLDVNKTMGAGERDRQNIGGHLAYRAGGLYSYFEAGRPDPRRPTVSDAK
jgi:hypothetical protein